MNFLSLLEAKRDGAPLSDEHIGFFVRGATSGAVPDYQLAAFLMAVYFRGLNDHEMRSLTLAMRDSGEKLAFPSDARPLADKHSTGGVGDKVSLPLAPLLASLGLRVPMISGRGLGITGGTLDKLESIPGFQTALPRERIVQVVQEIGCCIVGQTERMVPADRVLYALRDVTATVPSIPLITASILSKKLAESLDALILDVKWGSAAFMKEKSEAQQLADAMTRLGNASGVKTEAVLSEMNAPLGRAAGNWLEVVESVECLDGGGPPDLRSLVLECAARLLVLTGLETGLQAATDRAENELDSGRPRARWNAMLEAQGAHLESFEAKLSASANEEVFEIRSERSGEIRACDARLIGEIVRDLGGGRLEKGAHIDHRVGIDQMKKPGEVVKAGDRLCCLHARDQEQMATCEAKLRSAWHIE